MFHRIHVFPFRVTHPALGGSRAEVFGRPGRDGFWRGWLVFAMEEDNVVLISGPETSQPTREALVYWAIGLDPVQYQLALDRAFRGDPRRLRKRGAAAGEP